jgi:hypothetical protein
MAKYNSDDVQIVLHATTSVECLSHRCLCGSSNPVHILIHHKLTWTVPCTTRPFMTPPPSEASSPAAARSTTWPMSTAQFGWFDNLLDPCAAFEPWPSRVGSCIRVRRRPPRGDAVAAREAARVESTSRGTSSHYFAPSLPSVAARQVLRERFERSASRRVAWGRSGDTEESRRQGGAVG